MNGPPWAPGDHSAPALDGGGRDRAGLSRAEAARAAGISLASVGRLLADPAFARGLRGEPIISLGPVAFAGHEQAPAPDPLAGFGSRAWIMSIHVCSRARHVHLSLTYAMVRKRALLREKRPEARCTRGTYTVWFRVHSRTPGVRGVPAYSSAPGSGAIPARMRVEPRWRGRTPPAYVAEVNMGCSRERSRVCVLLVRRGRCLNDRRIAVSVCYMLLDRFLRAALSGVWQRRDGLTMRVLG